MRVGVITFPGSNCDADAVRFFSEHLEMKAQSHWYGDAELVGKYDLVILPGGFSYGDYLRAGALAARSPIMREVQRFSERGGWVLGICNGFQMLTEAQILPGALTENVFHHFICRVVTVEAQRCAAGWIPAPLHGTSFHFPVAHAQGRYLAPATTLEQLEKEGRVAFRYSETFNGSSQRIAGVLSENGRVLGLMPHPERAPEEGMRWLQTWAESV